MTMLNKIFYAFALVASVFLLPLGLCSGAFYLVMPLLGREESLVQVNTFLAGLTGLALCYGSLLLYHGLAGLRGQSSRPARLPPTGVLILLFFPLLGLGSLAAQAGPLTAWVLPPLHVLAALLPAAIIFAFAAPRLGPMTWRETVGQMAYGSLVAPLVALVIEAIAGAVIVAAVLGGLWLVPEGRAWLEVLAVRAQQPAWLDDPTNARALATSPPVLLILGLILIVVTPMTEEFLKALGVLLLVGQKPSQARAWLWGLTGGLGFAWAESLFNAGAVTAAWGLAMLLRAGATIMHACGAGLMGLGWRAAWVERRPVRLILAYLVSVGLHATWNVIAIGLALFILEAQLDLATFARSNGVTIFAAALVGLAAATLVLLILAVRRFQVVSDT